MVSGIPKTIASSLRVSSHLGGPTSMNILDEEKENVCHDSKGRFLQFQKSAYFS